MKKEMLMPVLYKVMLCLFVVSASFLVGCSDDPESTNEEEVITTISVTLTPRAEDDEEDGDVVTLSWDDTDLDAVVDATEIVVSGPLLSGRIYDAEIELLNKSADPVIPITDEIKKEAEDHIFCFTVIDAGIAITNRDEDKNGLPVGITSVWTTTAAASSGSVTITLRHQPGVKTGDCPGAGDTDASITFSVVVQLQGPE